MLAAAQAAVHEKAQAKDVHALALPLLLPVVCVLQLFRGLPSQASTCDPMPLPKLKILKDQHCFMPNRLNKPTWLEFWDLVLSVNIDSSLTEPQDWQNGSFSGASDCKLRSLSVLML